MGQADYRKLPEKQTLRIAMFKHKGIFAIKASGHLAPPRLCEKYFCVITEKS
jgi:hypothetical protein